jgi:uncharacterized OB-fold protein
VSERIYGIRTPVRLEYQYLAGRANSRFLRALAERRFVGQRCPQCGKVYLPPRGSCSTCGVPTDEEVEVAPTGTVTTFCVVNLPMYDRALETPYVCASVRLDGADLTLFHMIGEVPASDVRMGMRVEAVWVDDADLGATMESVRYFRPIREAADA